MRLNLPALICVAFFSLCARADVALEAAIEGWRLRTEMHIEQTFSALADQAEVRRARLKGRGKLPHEMAIKDLASTLDWRLPARLLDAHLLEDGLAERLDQTRARLLEGLHPDLLRDILAIYGPDDLARSYRGWPLPPTRLIELIRAQLGWSTCAEVVTLERKPKR